MTKGLENGCFGHHLALQLAASHGITVLLLHVHGQIPLFASVCSDTQIYFTIRGGVTRSKED